ncbi:hypothetical protein E2C01_054940 [Portunus trituberculatus]|uniref:Uncharacterized protein n=1 Tax=Portunus trituberculatus TaxID=210409 RepID=A0A5B7GL48_PORTR|nr:hypothetical protein [Portunus trituberculatus]
MSGNDQHVQSRLKSEGVLGCLAMLATHTSDAAQSREATLLMCQGDPVESQPLWLVLKGCPGPPASVE